MHRQSAPWAGSGSHICRSPSVRGSLLAIRQKRSQSLVVVSHAAAAWEARAPGASLQGQRKGQLQASHFGPYAYSRQDGKRRRSRVVGPASPSSKPGNSGTNSSLDWVDTQADISLHEGRPGRHVASPQGHHSSSGGQSSSESFLYHEANHGEGGSCCCDSSGPEGAFGNVSGQQDRGLDEGCEAPQKALVAANGQWEGEQQQPQQQQQQLQQQQPKQAAAAAVKQAPGRGVVYFVGAIAAVMVSGVANRVLYKMAITPLKNYVFFMAQLQTFGYCAVYFSVLLARYRGGKVSREQVVSVPGAYLGTFTRIGLVEALSSLLGFVGAANLPGVVLPLLSQTGLFWQVLLARFMLGKRLSSTQVGGVLLVVAGVALAAWPGKGGGSVLANVHPGYALLFVFSMLFPALSCIYKERVFREVREEKGQDLDLFVVNSYGSLAQAAFVFALLPVMTMVRGMTLAELPGYVARGFQCLRGLSPACGSDCAGAPLLPLAYVATNLVFNVAALSLIRVAGNVVMSLVMSALVPITIFAFTMDLPFLPPAPPVGPAFLAGAALLVGGLLAYNAPLWAPTLRSKLRQWLADSGPPVDVAGGARHVVAG